MKRISLAIVVFLCSLSILDSEENPQTRVAWTISNAPWFYESLYRMNNISFNTAVLLGLDFGGILVGVEPFCDYMSLNGQDPANLLQGASIDFGVSADAFFKPAKWMEIKLGAGGLFQRSVFQYNDSGWLGLNRWGVTGSFDIGFIPTDFIDFVVKNRFDLVFAFDAGDPAEYLIPNYSGGLRVDLRPGVEWLVVFAEADALYWNYSSELKSVQSWMFQAQLGVTLEFSLGETSGGIHGNNLGDKIVSKTIEDKEPALLVLGEMKPGTEASFTAIVFNQGKDELLEDSIPVLDRIADILLKHESAIISVQAYAEYSGNPVFDLGLVKIRAEKIMAHLAGRGVSESRIKRASMGQVINLENSKTEVPTVVIKVLSK